MLEKSKKQNQNKKSKSKDQFKFDSRQTKYIGKRSGKFLKYMDSQKSKDTIFYQFQNSSDSQYSSRISQKQVNSITFSKKQNLPIVQTNKNIQKEQISNKNIERKRLSNKQSQRLKNNQKIELKQINKNQKQVQQKEKKKKQNKLEEKIEQNIQQGKQINQNDEFVFQFDEEKFKRDRQQNYLNQALTNIQISQNISQQNNKSKDLPAKNNNLEDKKVNMQIKQKNKNKKQQRVNKNRTLQKQHPQEQRKKKKIIEKPKVKSITKHQKQKISEKQSKSKKSESLLSILNIQKHNSIFTESIQIENNKKLIGVISFLPNSKTNFKGFANKYSTAKIYIHKQTSNCKTQIFLQYLGSKTDFMFPNLIQSDIPFSIENTSKTKNVTLNFNLFKDQEQIADFD